MFVLQQEKLFELDQAQNKEFLFDLVYEIIKENPALQLDAELNLLVEPVRILMAKYIKKGINQINTLKYMVKSHVYLGVDFENDPQCDWINTEMGDYNIEEQVAYVNAFYEILENYKKRVVGQNFEYLLNAIRRIEKVEGDLNVLDKIKYIYPEKVNFLNVKNALNIENIDFSVNKTCVNDFVLGVDYEQNYFVKNIYNLEI